MIESYATFECTLPESNQNEWQALVEGLAQNKHGAYLEEYAEAFGEAAEHALEPLLDIWDEARGETDTRGSELKGNQAIIEMSGYRTVEPSIKSMVAFLKACGAIEVKVSTTLDSDYC